MTFVATLVIFATALSVTWLATQRTGRGHECSCSRSRRVLADYERLHPRSLRPASTSRPESLVLIPSSALVRNLKGGELTREIET